jgi:hypothetical protein
MCGVGARWVFFVRCAVRDLDEDLEETGLERVAPGLSVAQRANGEASVGTFQTDAFQRVAQAGQPVICFVSGLLALDRSYVSQRLVCRLTNRGEPGCQRADAVCHPLTRCLAGVWVWSLLLLVRLPVLGTGTGRVRLRLWITCG